jgi:hypothetical protein
MTEPTSEGSISLTTEGRNALNDASEILSSYSLDGKQLERVDVTVEYTEPTEPSEKPAGERRATDEAPGRVRPGTKEAKTLLAADGLQKDEDTAWWTNNELEAHLNGAVTNLTGKTSKLHQEKHLLDRRPVEDRRQKGPKYEYTLNTAGEHEVKRLNEL